MLNTSDIYTNSFAESWIILTISDSFTELHSRQESKSRHAKFENFKYTENSDVPITTNEKKTREELLSFKQLNIRK